MLNGLNMYTQAFKAFVCGLLMVLALSQANTVIADTKQTIWQYSVRPGDTLIALGRQHLINPSDWKLIQELNHVKNPYRLQAGSVLQIPLALVKSGPANAEVIFVSGDVSWQVSANQYDPLAVGQLLGPGAKVISKENSKAVIKFADETTTQLDSNSVLVLDALSLYSGGAMVDTKLRLQRGSAETHANPKKTKGSRMQIITPSAVAAVRGTRFRVEAGEQDMTQGTLEGKVAVLAANQEVFVNQGYGTRAEKGKPPAKPVVLLPAADTSQLPQQITALPATFDLPDMQGAKAWVAKVATDAAFNQINTELETSSQQLPFNDLPDGQLFLMLKAKDAQGIAGYDATHAFIVNARPFQPAYNQPASGEVVREAQPTLQWTAVDGANSYWLEVAGDASFNQLQINKRLQDTRFQFQEPLAPGQYYWRVRSVATVDGGAEDVGPTLTYRQFRYKAAPPVPDISQMRVRIQGNKAYVTTAEPPEDLHYEVRLDNQFNQQENVWQASRLGATFEFLLKEYGKQTLYIRHVDAEGIKSAEAVYEFDAQPEKDWFVY